VTGVRLRGTNDARTRRALAYCRTVARTQARNFYYGMMLTPEPRRTAMYTVYAFMRACDDLADGDPAPLLPPGGEVETGVAARAAALDRFEAAMDRVLAGQAPAEDAPVPELWPAFRWLLARYPLERKPLAGMLAGQRQDLAGGAIASFEDLETYCERVAGTVGEICITIWGYEGAEATRRLAIERGVALQLTNILRDVREDHARGRCYLPEEDLARFGLARERLLEGGEAFEALVRDEAERAARLYDASAPLEARLSPACRATCRTLTGIYRGLLDKILADPGRVLRERVRLGGVRKLAVAGGALAQQVVRR